MRSTLRMHVVAGVSFAQVLCKGANCAISGMTAVNVQQCPGCIYLDSCYLHISRSICLYAAATALPTSPRLPPAASGPHHTLITPPSQVDAGVADQLVFGDPTAPRFVFWEKKLRPTPSGLDAITFDLMSLWGKIRAGLGAIGIANGTMPSEQGPGVAAHA